MSIKLERIGQAPFAPAPKAVRAGDYSPGRRSWKRRRAGALSS